MREEILKALEKNAKIDLHDLSLMLNVSEDIILNEIAKLESEKVICGYHTLINWDKAGSATCTALIEVKVTPQRGVGFDKIASRIMQYDEVDSVYLMAGDYDFAVFIEGKTMKEVSKFVFEKLSTLDSVLSTATHFVLKKYKDHGTDMSDIKVKDKRMMVVS